MPRRRHLPVSICPPTQAASASAGGSKAAGRRGRDHATSDSNHKAIPRCAKAPRFRVATATSLARLLMACQVFLGSGPQLCTHPIPPPSCYRAQGQPRELSPNILSDDIACFSPATYSPWSESLIAWSHPRLPAAFEPPATDALAGCVDEQIDTGKWRLLGMAPQTEHGPR